MTRDAPGPADMTTRTAGVPGPAGVPAAPDAPDAPDAPVAPVWPAEISAELPAALPVELIEKLRQTGIRLDREGRFWHEGAEVTHAGFRRALLSWLDRLDDGRPILRLDERRYAYIDVEDAHLLAVSARWCDDRAFLRLNDGSEEELDYASLRMSRRDNALYCAVRRGRLEARITTAAYYVLAERIEPVDATGPDDSFVLHARGQTFSIGHRPDR